MGGGDVRERGLEGGKWWEGVMGGRKGEGGGREG